MHAAHGAIDTFNKGVTSMPRPGHFDISANDPDGLVKFYSSIFGWRFNKWQGGPMEYWVIETGKDQPGIDGGLRKRNGDPAVTKNTIAVPSVDDFCAKITAAGGKATPMGGIPGVG